MRRETIIRLTDAFIWDIDAKSAAFQLAWHRTAQDLWSRREYDTDHRALFARHLRAAHADVAQQRRYHRAAAAAKNHPRIIALRAERDDLHQMSFHMHIGQRVNQIDAEIASITQNMAH